MIPVDPSPLRAQVPSAAGGWVALDAAGGLSPLRGRLPPAAGRFPAAAPVATRRRRVPAGAFVTVTRLGPRRPPDTRAGSAAIVPLAPRRLERKHKLMLALAAMVLVLGASNARRTWRPPAVLVEEPARSGHALATAPGVAAPQNPLL
ncbi:hypothetical protein [Methylobacterium oryzihabitans]|uniref:Uncharacterized protein n=1 Tax=Methylobacterium oryzihabitans TaxID=2499852 RepID=A0A3S2YPV5_9HYPH|nr:hypothetical protein [Methylobacterium oryzihabitans]RVU16592.1 hypothetical protein EOE48_16055 [Methylobacterium oryzihabitans]